jgi:ribosomal protein S2
MKSYYTKLISRTKLISFWIFSGNDLKLVFRDNYKLLSLIYNKKAIIDFNRLIFDIQKVIPLFNTFCSSGAELLFVGFNSMYSQTIHSYNSSNIGNQFFEWKVGTLTNFSLQGFGVVKHWKLTNQPSVLFFLHQQNNNLLLLEAKKKNLLTISLLDETVNCSLIDFLICVSSLYFYNIYFFSKFFFRYLSLSI